MMTIFCLYETQLHWNFSLIARLKHTYNHYTNNIIIDFFFNLQSIWSPAIHTMEINVILAIHRSYSLIYTWEQGHVLGINFISESYFIFW